MLLTEPRWGGTRRNHAMAVLAGAAFAASMFIRPNFALAVAWLGVAYLWMSVRRRDLAQGAAFAGGLALALWMPLHNWYYGRELYLISKSGATLSVPLGPRDYAAAGLDLLRGRTGTHAIAVTGAQLKGWLGGPVFVGGDPVWLAGPAHILNLLTLGLCAWIAVTWMKAGRERSAVAVIAVAALCAHLPMLFIFDTSYRYAMLGWDLGVIVFILWLSECLSAFVQAHARTSRVAVAPDLASR
jgi:hypothetical protein